MIILSKNRKFRKKYNIFLKHAISIVKTDKLECCVSLLLINFDLIVLLGRVDLLVNGCPFFRNNFLLFLINLLLSLQILILIHQLLHSLLMCLLLLLFSQKIHGLLPVEIGQRDLLRNFADALILIGNVHGKGVLVCIEVDLAVRCQIQVVVLRFPPGREHQVAMGFVLERSAFLVAKIQSLSE